MTETGNSTETKAPARADSTPKPAHHLPMSQGTWAYSRGGGEPLPRGVYRASQGRWHWLAPLPYVTTRLTARDGDGRRSGLRYRITMDLDAPAGAAAVCTRREIDTGEWAQKLDVPLSSDRRVQDAAASAIVHSAYHEDVATAETVPQWVDRQLVMPPADLDPAWYQSYAADEERAVDAWREILTLCAESPRLGLALGAAVGGLYIKPLDRQSFILDLVGGGRRGKSTALYAGACVYGWSGSPAQPGGIIRSADATPQGLQQTLRSLAVLPAFVDETGSSKPPVHMREQFIMSILQSNSRSQGGREGDNPRRHAPWHGVYMATGNEAVAEGVTNEATWARVITLPTPITTSHQAAERVAELGPIAYGWPLQWILREPDTDGMAQRVAAWENTLPMPEGGAIPGTIARHLALMVAGLELITDLVGGVEADVLGPAVQEARARLSVMVTELSERGITPSDRLLSAVTGALASHPHTFPTLDTYKRAVTCTPDEHGQVPTLPATVDGFIPRPGWVSVLHNRLRAVASEAGIKDPTTALRDLARDGILITNPDRHQKRWNVHQGQGAGPRKVWTYTLALPEEEGGPPQDADHEEAQHTGPAPPAPTAEGKGARSKTRSGELEPDPRPDAPTASVPAPQQVGTEQAAEPAPPVAAPAPRRAPARPTQGGETVVALTVTADTLYLGTLARGPGGATESDVRPVDAVEAGVDTCHLGRVLDYAARAMPTGGTIAVDHAAAEALGWPEEPEPKKAADWVMPDRPRCYQQAAQHSWFTSSPVGGWTTWERGKRYNRTYHEEQGHELDHVGLTVAVLPWMDNGYLGTSTEPGLHHKEDDAQSSCYMLTRMHQLLGHPWAYGAGSSMCMTMRSKWVQRNGRPRKIEGGRPPLLVLPGELDHYPGYSLPETGMSWTQPGAVDGGRHDERYVIGYDSIAQHAGMLSRLYPLDRPELREDVEFDKNVPALWWLDQGPYLAPWGMPLVQGATAPGVGAWVHTEIVQVLIEQRYVSAHLRTRAWVPVGKEGQITRGSQILKPLGTRVSEALQSIPRETEDPLESRLRDNLKSAYAEMAGQLTNHSLVKRPDWSMVIMAGAKAQILRRAFRVYKETGKSPLKVNVDCLYYETDGPDPVENNPAPQILKFDKTRSKAGHVKDDFKGTMAEYIAKKQKKRKKGM